METCQHNKVYADYILTSNPPKIPWICSKCGEKGIEEYVAIEKKLDYEELIQKFKIK